jgi:hypothetical protein
MDQPVNHMAGERGGWLSVYAHLVMQAERIRDCRNLVPLPGQANGAFRTMPGGGERLTFTVQMVPGWPGAGWLDVFRTFTVEHMIEFQLRVLNRDKQAGNR